jgi:SEC-C motif
MVIAGHLGRQEVWVAESGRNAPCACGSGRKAKHCCGVAGRQDLAGPSTASGISQPLGWTGLLGDELSEVERQIVRAAGTGGVVDLRVGGDRAGSDPASGALWGVERTVRAGLLAELVTGVRHPETGRLRAIRLFGAKVVGELDLASSTVLCPLVLGGCYFAEVIDLWTAEAPVVSLMGCHMPGLEAGGLRTRGHLMLGGVWAAGTVVLSGARIGGQLDLSGARLANPKGVALLADELVVDMGMFCRDGFTAEGEVRLNGARIGGVLDFGHAALSNEDETALSANGLTVAGSLEAKSEFSATGAVWLFGAHIGGNLHISGAHMTNPEGMAFVGDQLVTERSLIGLGFAAEGEVHLSGARIGGSLMLQDAKLTNPHGEVALKATLIAVEQDVECIGLSAQGEVHLSGAQIGGYFMLDGAHLAHGGKKALSMDNMKVGQGVYCRHGFTTQGEMRMVGAEFRELILDGAMLSNTGGAALAADGISVTRDVACTEGFAATGEVRLPYGHVAGSLYLQGATLVNPRGRALTSDQLTVKQSMRCEGLSAKGQVSLLAVSVGGQLVFAGAELINPDGYALLAQNARVALDMACSDGFTVEGGVDLTHAQIDGRLDLDGAKLTGHDEMALDLEAARIGRLRLSPAETEGRVDLTDARVGELVDDPSTWPADLELVGLVYETLDSAEEVSVRERLRWLTLHTGGYRPQPYDQLAAAYRNEGDEEAARKVAIAKQRQRRSQLNPLGRAWNWLLYVTVGYGYRTWWAGMWLAALTVAGSWAFNLAYPGDFVPVGDSPPEFHPVAYTLDTVLPIIDLGQQRAWAAQGVAMYASWVFIAAGWVLTSAVVAGVTGVLKRE